MSKTQEIEVTVLACHEGVLLPHAPSGTLRVQKRGERWHRVVFVPERRWFRVEYHDAKRSHVRYVPETSVLWFERENAVTEKKAKAPAQAKKPR